jgi:hypothetical protein
VANIYDTLPGDDAPSTGGNIYDSLPGDDGSQVKTGAPEMTDSQKLVASVKPNNGVVGRNLNHAADELHEGLSSAYHTIVGGYKGLASRVTGGSWDDAADAVNAETAQTYRAPAVDMSGLPGGKEPGEIGGGAFLDTVPQATHAWAEHAADKGHAQLATALESAVPASQALAGGLGLMRGAEALPPRASAVTPRGASAAAEPAALPAAGTGSDQSLSAMHAAPDISAADPDLHAAIQSVNKPNETALERHLDAAQLPLPEGTSPLRLRKGQATGDDQQISDEKNLRADPDTQGILSDSINDQNTKLGASMSEIRRQATPDIVQRTNAEHDQAVIDAIKAHDNAMVTDTRTKYKALADANGGAIPIDTGAAISGIDSQLGHNYLTQTANENSVISPILSDLRSGAPISFERFENARTRLAELQRTNTPDGVAAGIVRNTLENLPLPPEAAPLKDLADQARAAAKARFDIIKANPAYDAAINDNVPKKQGLHVIGAPSPLAGSFLDKYATGNGATANPALVNRLKEAVPDPIVGQSIEASALNKLRDAAGIDEFGAGNFRNNQFRTAVKNLTNKGKSNALLSPESLDGIQRLDRVSGYVNNEGKASSTNRSNTMVALQRFGAVPTEVPSVTRELTAKGLDTVGDVAAGHIAGAPGVVAKRIGQGILKGRAEAKSLQAMKDAKLKFAIDATKPGAGLDYEVPAPRTARASGGRVDEDALVERLVRKWKAAKIQTDKSTKTLLQLPDAAIVRALDIAQRNI